MNMKAEKSQRKAKYTSRSLMDALKERLETEGLVPDILDYFSTKSYPPEVELRNYEFINDSCLEFGGNEGIYLKFRIKGIIDDTGEYKSIPLGTAKTLREDREAMEIMGKFLGDFVYELTAFVNQNIEDFTYLGFNVGTKERVFYEIRDKERAMAKAEEIMKKYGNAKVVSNSTGEEWQFSA